MTAQIIDGKSIAKEIHETIARDVPLLAKGPPGLAVIIVGEDPSSRVYVNMKRKACKKAGLRSEEFSFPQDATENQIIDTIDLLNVREEIHGILVQVPLPAHLDTARILDRIHPGKDVDCFHPVNVGKLFLGRPSVLPCTPAGVMVLLESINYDFRGKKACIVGRSNIVGKPIAMLLLMKHSTVTFCHSKTKDLALEVGSSDLVVAATGSPNLIKGEWIKPGAVVIDVGTSRVGDNLVGDVEFESAAQRASFITPVPGGVGPMTIAMLLRNTVLLCSRESRHPETV